MEMPFRGTLESVFVRLTAGMVAFVDIAASFCGFTPRSTERRKRDFVARRKGSAAAWAESPVRVPLEYP